MHACVCVCVLTRTYYLLQELNDMFINKTNI